METGLVLSLPGLAPVLRRWRKHDPAARLGMPPHVTLIHPFMDSAAVDEAVRGRLRAALAPFGPPDLVFDRLGRFEGGVWLEMADPAPALAMIDALARVFPAWPPYGGAFAEVVPHVTVAQAPAKVLARIEREAPRALPLAVRAEAVTLFARSSAGWVPLERFVLSGTG